MGTTSEKYGFGTVDYIVFGSTIVLSLAVGLFQAFSGRKQHTTESYLMGNRRLQMLPVALSLLVSFESSILMLGHPAEIYTYGIMIWWSTFGGSLSFILGARILTRLFHPFKLTSVFQYLEMRYKHRAPRQLGAILGMLYYLFYMGTVLFGPAVALASVADVPMWLTIVVVAFVAMIYTSLGGIKAVVWTDVLQLFIMTGGLILIITKGALDVGGMDNVWRINSISGRLNFFNFSPDPRVRLTFWNTFPSAIFRNFGMVFNQATVQRVNSVKTETEGMRVLYIAGVLFLIMGSMVALQGLITHAYFYTLGCDPLESGQIENANQIGVPGMYLAQVVRRVIRLIIFQTTISLSIAMLVPFMMVRMFQNLPGLSGLFIAALFSASLSTLSSGMNAMSAQLTEDFIKPRYKITDAKATNIAKISVFVFGCMAIGISFMIAEIQGSLQQIYVSLLTCFSGPVAGIFFYSIFCPWATTKGALSGGVFAAVFIFWVSMGQSFSPTMKLQPWLPPNPTTQCFDNQDVVMNGTTWPSMNYTIVTFNISKNLRNYHHAMEEFWESRDNASGLDPLYSLSHAWFGTLSILLTLFVASMVSLVTGYPKREQLDIRLLLPLGDTLFPYLPRRIQRLMDFGLKFDERERLMSVLVSADDYPLVDKNEEKNDKMTADETNNLNTT